MKILAIDAKDMQCCVAPENGCAGPKCMGFRAMEGKENEGHGYCGRAGPLHGDSLHAYVDVQGSINNQY